MILSAGLLVYRRQAAPEFLLAHPGGPFWRGRDLGAWTTPKGLLDPGEEPLATARREFNEETGLRAEGPAEPLSPVRLKSGKRVFAWLTEADLRLEGASSNTFELEWPKGSGRMQVFPEIDKIAYFPAEEAILKINPAQAAFIREAVERLGARA